MAPVEHVKPYLYSQCEPGLMARQSLLTIRELEVDTRAQEVDARQQDVEAMQARLLEQEAALRDREEALNDLEFAMRGLKAEMESQPQVPEVARTPKKRPKQRGRRMVIALSVSPRRRMSPRKKRQSNLSTASTSAGSSSSCASPARPGRHSRTSTSSAASFEEPPPRAARNVLTEFEPTGGLLSSFPVPLSMTSWDWPLSRDEKKSLVLMFDRQELMVQRDDVASELCKLKIRCRQLAID